MAHAAVTYKTSDPLKIEEVVYRAPREHEVLVKIAACGVCHSDLSILNELYPAPMPVILGHEAAGVVQEVGPGVTGLQRGDHVVGLWRPSCGECRYCKAGRAHLCKLGEDPTSRAGDRVKAGDTAIFEFLGIGGFSEYTILSDNALVKIDKSMPLDRAALLGCAVVTGFGAATNCAHIHEGDEVAVFGCGGVGLNIIQGAKHRGAKTIIAVDIDDAKLEMAKQFGATHGVNGREPDTFKAVKKLTVEGQGPDYAFDAVGHTGLIDQAFKSVCRGGEVILVGIPHRRETVPVSPILSVLSEKGIKGSLGGSASPARAVSELVGLYQTKKLKLDELVTRKYSLRETNEAIDDLRQGKNARGVLVMD
jgi:Zn-dependent alcohol dehydrogenase